MEKERRGLFWEYRKKEEVFFLQRTYCKSSPFGFMFIFYWECFTRLFASTVCLTVSIVMHCHFSLRCFRLLFTVITPFVLFMFTLSFLSSLSSPLASLPSWPHISTVTYRPGFYRFDRMHHHFFYYPSTTNVI